jgi:hypothetical protein
MAERDIRILPVPEGLISTVKKNGVNPLAAMIQKDVWNRFKLSEEFVQYVDKHSDNLFLNTLTNGQSALYCVFVKYLFSNFKKSDEFQSFVNKDCSNMFFENATDGESGLYQLFRQHCEKEHNDEQLRYLLNLKQTLRKFDHYDDFMKSFHAAMADVEDMNISFEDKQELKKIHDKYWGSKKETPKDLLNLDGSRVKSKPLKKTGSDPDLGKEKTKDKPKRKKEKAAVEEGDVPRDDSLIRDLDAPEGRRRRDADAS